MSEPNRTTEAGESPASALPSGTTLPAPDHALTPGGTAGSMAPMPTLPGYEFVRELGRGGMGVVYLATQTALRRPTAVKLIRDGALAGPEQRRRFLVEAEAVGRLRHPNIVQVYESGEHQGMLYCAFEYAEGGSLDQHRDLWPLPPARAAGLVEALALAVQHAHERGIIHRDLKPSNVLLRPAGDDFEPLVGDFGLARRLDADSLSLTHTGAVMGTPSYMAPEQADGLSKDVGPAADIFSLGAVLYDLLAGRPPFRGPTPLVTLDQVRYSPPPPLPAGVPIELAAICLKCLQKDPVRRYASAAALAVDLFRFRAGEPVTAEAPPFTSADLLATATPSGPRAGEVRRFEGSGQWISCVALSPDERLAASGGRDRAVRVWDVDTGREVRRFDGHDSAVHCVAFSPDGRFVFSGTGDFGGRDAAVRVWDLAAGREVRRLDGHKRAVLSLCPTPDGTGLLTAGADGVVALWHLGEGREVRRFEGDFRDQVNQVVITPDGSEFLACGHDGTAVLRNLTDGRRVLTLQPGVGALWGVAFTPTGDRFACCGDAVAVYPNHGRFRAAMHRAARGYLCLGFTADGRGVVTGDKSGLVGVWDLATGRERARFGGHSAQVTGLAIFRDGRRALTAGGDGSLRLWGLPPASDDTDPGFASRPVPLWGVCAGHTDEVRGVAFSADGSRLLSWAVNGPIRLWDPETGEDLACLDGHEGGTLSAAFLPDGTALSCGQDGVVRRWDLLAGRQEAEVCRSDRPFNCLSLAPDGRHFLTGGDDCLARLWSLGGEEVRRYAGHTDEVWAVVASPDGQRIVSGGKDGTLRWWDAASGLARSRLGGWFTGRPKGRTQTLCFLPDGTRLWAAGPDGPVEEYDPAPKLVRRLPAASSGTNGLALLADGRLLAACRDGSVRLWDAAGEVQLACWREHERGVWGVAVSPDGRTAASAGSEGHVCVWRVPPAPTSGRVSGDPGVGSGR